jgi:hypothetical protein
MMNASTVEAPARLGSLVHAASLPFCRKVEDVQRQVEITIRSSTELGRLIE